jgi:hypothetical protein
VKPKRETEGRKLRDWTMDEIKVLRGHGRLGAKALLVILNANRALVRPDVAPLTLSAIYCKAYDLRVSLRRQGSRSGRRMALPASMRIGDVGKAADLVRSGRIDMATVARNVIADAHGELTLCPSCSKRPATVRDTGLCVACHKALLIEHLNDAADAYEVKKQQWVAQQRVSRARRAVSDAEAE